jgi:hypothetical protein
VSAARIRIGRMSFGALSFLIAAPVLFMIGCGIVVFFILRLALVLLAAIAGPAGCRTSGFPEPAMS